jgi:hypothetical protein
MTSKGHSINKKPRILPRQMAKMASPDSLRRKTIVSGQTWRLPRRQTDFKVTKHKNSATFAKTRCRCGTFRFLPLCEPR